MLYVCVCLCFEKTVFFGACLFVCFSLLLLHRLRFSSFFSCTLYPICRVSFPCFLASYNNNSSNNNKNNNNNNSNVCVPVLPVATFIKPSEMFLVNIHTHTQLVMIRLIRIVSVFISNARLMMKNSNIFHTHTLSIFLLLLSLPFTIHIIFLLSWLKCQKYLKNIF